MMSYELKRMAGSQPCSSNTRTVKTATGTSTVTLRVRLSVRSAILDVVSCKMPSWKLAKEGAIAAAISILIYPLATKSTETNIALSRAIATNTRTFIHYTHLSAPAKTNYQQQLQLQ